MDGGGAYECAEALSGQAASGACPRWCFARDFGCSDSLICEADGGHRVVRGCRDGGAVSCLPFATGTRLSGSTPLGDIDFRNAWGSPSWAFARDLVVQLGETPTAYVSPASSLGFYTSIDPHDAGELTVARLVLDGGVAFGPASVILDAVDAGRAHGSVIIQAPGWSVSGAFDIPLCAEMDRSGP